MAWWMWTIIGITGWTAGAYITTFLWMLTTPREERAMQGEYTKQDGDMATWVFFFWPFFLLAWPVVNGKRLFFTILNDAGMKADAVATKIERSVEIRKLRDMHEVKEEETYPIPHTTEAQWRQAQNIYSSGLYERINKGGKAE